MELPFLLHGSALYASNLVFQPTTVKDKSLLNREMVLVLLLLSFYPGGDVLKGVYVF